MSVRPSICPSVRLSVCPSVRPSVCLPVCLSDCLSVRFSVCLSICLSVCLFLCMSICLSIYKSVCLSIQLSVCPSVRLSVRLSQTFFLLLLLFNLTSFLFYFSAVTLGVIAFISAFLMVRNFRNRLLSAGLKPVFSQTEKLCKASYYRQFSAHIKIIKLIPVLLVRAFDPSGLTKLNIIIFHFIIHEKLSIIRCEK